MPELPEVETIRRGLADLVAGRRIQKLFIGLPRLIKRPDPEGFAALVTGRVILSLERRGKYLLLWLDGQIALVIHLRMTGRLYYRKPEDASDPYTRLVFDLDNGDRLVFADVRTLGTLYAVPEAELGVIHGLAALGPEPLSQRFTVEYLVTALKRKRSTIKSLLLNQEIIGGLGNIYVDESLFMAGIHPERTGDSLNDLEITRLHCCINQVIDTAIANMGTTFRDYRDSSGREGSHQHHLAVYGRKNMPCPVCGSSIVKIEVGGRGTCFCPQCQQGE